MPNMAFQIGMATKMSKQAKAAKMSKEAAKPFTKSSARPRSVAIMTTIFRKSKIICAHHFLRYIVQIQIM